MANDFSWSVPRVDSVLFWCIVGVVSVVVWHMHLRMDLNTTSRVKFVFLLGAFCTATLNQWLDIKSCRNADVFMSFLCTFASFSSFYS